MAAAGPRLVLSCSLRTERSGRSSRSCARWRRMPTLTLAPKPKKVAAESNVSTELSDAAFRVAIARAHGGDTSSRICPRLLP